MRSCSMREKDKQLCLKFRTENKRMRQLDSKLHSTPKSLELRLRLRRMPLLRRLHSLQNKLLGRLVRRLFKIKSTPT